MILSDFDYDLPKELIAQQPVSQRDQSRLLMLNLSKDTIDHLKFNQIINILNKGDTLVVNNTRVINARLFGHKTTGGKIELLILEPYLKNKNNNQTNIITDCLIKGKVKPGMDVILNLHPKKDNLLISNRQIKVHVLENISGGRFRVEFDSEIPFHELLSSYGQVPLPPYIKQELNDPERYQTIYSNNLGSIAAPTAGLHFTHELFNKIKNKGVKIVDITLHINYGTFTPVRTEDITLHQMEREYAILTKKSSEIINSTIESNGRLVAVGTTTVRTLETIALRSSMNRKKMRLEPWEGWTDLFIYPGFEFKSGINFLITNFHLPKSTLLMLVCAFATREKIFKAYREAIEKRYRFYSLGDAMMIIK